MAGKLTDRASALLVIAQREARRWGHDYVGTEHLLLGLVEDGSDVGAQVLEALGATPARVRREIELLVTPGPPGDEHAAAGELPLTPRAQRALQFAGEAAGYVSHDRIDSEHVLVGLLQEDEGVAGRVLRNMGLSPAQVADEVFKIRVLQMTIVERAVRPVRAPLCRKRRMREELLAHLTSIYDEEQAALNDPAAAAAEAVRRFGDTGELAREFDRAVTWSDRLSYYMERVFAWRAPETVVRFAGRLAVTTAAITAMAGCAVLALVLTILDGRPFPWELLRVYAGVTIMAPPAVFALTWLSIKMRDAMWGAFGSPRSLARVAGLNALIATVALGTVAGLTVVARGAWPTPGEFWPSWLAAAAVMSLASLASAWFEGPKGIRDTVWACLDVGSASVEQSEAP